MTRQHYGEDLNQARTVSLDRVANMITAQTGLRAGVADTGGQVATVLVGVPDEGDRYKLLLGPGWFDADGQAFGDTREMTYGPDDDGDMPAVSIASDMTEEQLAESIGEYILSTVVGRAVVEVCADIMAGRLPPGVGSLAEAHDHVDANEYGGLTAEMGPINFVDEDHWRAFAHRVWDKLDESIVEGWPQAVARKTAEER